MSGNSYMAGLGVPQRFLGARLPADHAGVVPNADGLFITGPAGVGKSWLAAAWMRRILSELPLADLPLNPALWCSVPRFLQELRGTFGGRGSEAEVTRQYTKPALLVLDDLGSEHASDWTGQALYLVVSKRLDDCKQTIVTSNLTREELDRRDPRLASRIGALAYCRMTGIDRRVSHA